MPYQDSPVVAQGAGHRSELQQKKVILAVGILFRDVLELDVLRFRHPAETNDWLPQTRSFGFSEINADRFLSTDEVVAMDWIVKL